MIRINTKHSKLPFCIRSFKKWPHIILSWLIKTKIVISFSMKMLKNSQKQVKRWTNWIFYTVYKRLCQLHIVTSCHPNTGIYFYACYLYLSRLYVNLCKKVVTKSMIKMKIKSVIKINFPLLVFTIYQGNKLDNRIIMIHFGGQQKHPPKGMQI